jgi:thymidylate synthase ThyX
MTSRPTARLLSTTEHPIETLYCLWKASRSTTPVPSPAEVHEDIQVSQSARNEVMQTFAEVVNNDISVAENLDFVFLLENVPISLREQMVRHRIGHRFGENFGVDIVPGDVQDSWWSQTTRILDMGTFASDENYFTPDTIDDRDVQFFDPVTHETSTTGAQVMYEKHMLYTEEVYKALVGAGVPKEDARQIIPLAATSRISWKMNYQSLKHILKRRTCWIAQLGMWEGIIHDMVNELAEKIHPVFRTIAQPPCFRQDAFIGCPFGADNLERIRGVRDEIPPCPLYMVHHRRDIDQFVPVAERFYHPAGAVRWDTEDGAKRERFAKMQEAYARLWGRNPWTGEKE